VQSVPRSLASGTAGTGHAAPRQRRACARGRQRSGVWVASLTCLAQSSAAVCPWRWPSSRWRQRRGRRGWSCSAWGPGGTWRVVRGGQVAASRGPRGGVPRHPAPVCGVRVQRGAGSRRVVPWSGGVLWGGGGRGVKAQPGASSRAQPGRAGDGGQRPLRSRCPPRLTPSVRLPWKDDGWRKIDSRRRPCGAAPSGVSSRSS
jgi:hypothetical protein